MSEIRSPQLSILELPFGRWLLPVGAFLLILLSTLGFAHHLEQQRRLDAQGDFAVETALVAAEIRDQVRNNGLFLLGLRAFINRQPRLDQAHWSRFTSAQEIREHLPGIQAFGYLARVPTAQLGAFELWARQELANPTYQVFPPPSGEAAFPVLFLSPPEPSNLQARGFDLASESRRWQAMAMARDSDRMSMSQRLQLASDQQAPPQPGFVLFLPVYVAGASLNTVEARRQALQGFVFAAYRMSDFIQTLNYSRNPRLMLQIFDDESFDGSQGGAQLTLLHDTHPDVATESTLEVNDRELAFGHRSWLLRFRERPLNSSSNWRNPAVIALVFGSVLATLAGAILLILTAQGQRALAMAQGMTTRLDRSEERFRLAAEGAKDGLWHRDFSENSVYFSERFLALLGYAPGSVVQTEEFFLGLLHPEDIPRRRQALDAHLKNRQPYDVEVRLRRANGTWGWFHLKGQATWSAQGLPLLMAGSISDISDRKQAELELRQHRDRLQELVEERTRKLENALEDARGASRAKSEFLANMSHELRTPLHAMLSFASLGQDRSSTQGEEKLHRYFERIRQSAERLLSLVNDLLDLSKLEAQRMDVVPETQDLRPILEQVAAELDPLLQTRHLSLNIHQECPHTIAQAAPQRFAQVLRNLLANAIKFSPPEGEITISFQNASLPRGRRAADQGQIPALAIVIEDQGPGIPVEELEMIFDKFAQSSRTRTGAGGTGLGLAICREIMVAHRGAIRAENVATGGARIIATLPVARELSPQEETTS